MGKVALIPGIGRRPSWHAGVGWTAKTDFQQELARAYAWYLANVVRYTV